MLIKRENRPRNNLSDVFEKRSRSRSHRKCSSRIGDINVGDTNVDAWDLILMTIVRWHTWDIIFHIRYCHQSQCHQHHITILNNTTETADEAINKHIDRGCSLKAYKSVRNRWVAHINLIWVIVYESFYLFIQYESHGVTLKLNFEIFTCMFVKLETIMKIRNRNVKGRVSPPSFMVSEK